ncbi:carbamoyltransferase C-terminal domain-containing protein [Methanococcus aeolicus]|uniref:carbamoyltransferase C-terminal domain-containing protein n=1 Tax=Methanococcus aeolicus TaxID=42879 RepID=UPI0021C933BA|nr:carbamoyltransferase C-terminal domain-containing protein [Methanococcus aeolicus]UXM84632.1 hypothetical protein N6C89_07820 [Methanococcus aeolicus]
MILGLTDGHNASACLIDNNNNLKYALCEERFTRKKNQRGAPINSINYIINSINNNTENTKNTETDKKPEIITVGGMFRKGKRLKELKEIQRKLNIPMLYFNHHLCHASLYKLSNFKNEECLIITMDGGGDGFSSTVSIGSNKGIEPIAQSDLIDSMGDFYASITEVLGFKPMEDEGKVMSLSSYDGDIENIDLNNLKIIEYNKEIKTINNYLGVVGFEATKALKKIFNLNKINIKDFNSKILISKYAQKTLESEVLKLINEFSNETGIKNIVFSGGVAQNVQLNKKIMENYNLFVPPFMGDEGLSVGASLLYSNKFTDLKTTYLGYNIENININKIVGDYKIKYIEEKEIPETIGNLLINNKIICICRNKMEFGARALGNRSILALPKKENAKKINKMLNRDSFMPFAPTMLYDYVEEYFKNPHYNPFMTTLFDVKKEYINKIDGVVHNDDTTRAQTLKKEFNPTYYNIIDYVNGVVNVPFVLNTSFNLHGEPIVCNEQDALKSFKSVGDALLLGNYLFMKI